MGVKLDNLEGSFSAVSTPIFAGKYSLEWRIFQHSKSSWRDLQDLHTFALWIPIFAPLQTQNGWHFAWYILQILVVCDFVRFKICEVFNFARSLPKSVIFRRDFHGNLPEQILEPELRQNSIQNFYRRSVYRRIVILKKFGQLFKTEILRSERCKT